jgi:hypothetical protein
MLRPLSAALALTAVSAAAAAPECSNVILASFGGEPYDESLYLSYSSAPSGPGAVQFTPLNDGNPVLTSEIGAKTIRDPFVQRSPTGGFRIVTSDMVRPPPPPPATSRVGSQWSW